MIRIAVIAVIACAWAAASPVPVPGAATSEVAFSPHGSSLGAIVQAIGEAKESILAAAYSFTSKPISLALLEAHKRGVKVQVIVDSKSNGPKARYSAATFLANQGVPVRLNGRYAIFHHKFLVVDGVNVQTGSFNYSAAAAEKNAENVLVLRGVPTIAAAYAAEWQRLWDEADPLAPKY